MSTASAVSRRCPMMLLIVTLAGVLTPLGWALADAAVIPFAKQVQRGEGVIDVSRVRIEAPEGLANEASALRAALAAWEITESDGGVSIVLRIGPVDTPPVVSAQRDAIIAQAYRVEVEPNRIILQAPTATGVFYAVQTLRQLVTDDRRVAVQKIVDWPDLAVRAIMVDMARANENADYYGRVIEFCARYKINRLHMHLTDDENASLYHEDYPSIMHPHAWRPTELGTLIRLAERNHIDIVPEIESLGHARLFTRHPDARALLHQTTDETPKKSWAGSDLPGYTNVLCPASEKVYAYLRAMYARTAEVFPFPETHVGFDEVDMTTCGACLAAFPKATPESWYLRHLRRCAEIVHGEKRTMSLWGDMILHHPDIVKDLAPEGLLIYDWHYTPNMTDASAVFFKRHGFTVMGCPALVCHPHMILPSDFNYRNIARFAQIAREQDLLGLDTTVWTPIRYLSDVLWPGLAFASTHAWGGSQWDEAAFHRAFVRDFFGSPEGDAFADAWTALADIRWWLDDFKASCWLDDPSLDAAAVLANGKKGEAARRHRAALRDIKAAFLRMDSTVQRQRPAWAAIIHSVEILDYTLAHLLAAVEVRTAGSWNRARLGELDRGCVEAIGWITADWDRNRFSDDPYKADLARTGQHLLDRFCRMHAYHQAVLGRGVAHDE